MIKLTDKYYLDFEPMNIILKEKIVLSDKAKNAGKERFDCIGYYGNFDSLVTSLIYKQIIDNSDIINELKDIVKIIKSSEVEIIRNLEEHVKNEKL
jgi:uncharacterized DUF497 family protein